MDSAISGLTTQGTNIFWSLFSFAFIILMIIMASSGFMGSRAKEFAKENTVWLFLAGVGIGLVGPITAFFQGLG